MKYFRKFLFVVKVFVFLFFVFILGNVALYLYAYITPKIDINSNNSIVFYDNEGKSFFESSSENKWASISDISKYVIDATVATEDKNFYIHKGFDFLRIAKAMYVNFKNGNISQGASTISQQYIKNLYLTFDKTWDRKIEEAFLTLELETHYSKDEILEGYLNSINYGSGQYGIENASKYYFNKSASKLSLAEASILVGIPKNPSLYNPISNLEKSKERQKIVLNSMLEEGYITEEELDIAFNTDLVFYGQDDPEAVLSINYYKDAVLQELQSISSIPDSLIKSGGLHVYTNLDVDAQKKMENIIMEEMDGQTDYQVASIAVEPGSGKVIALIGGTNYNLSEFNRVTQAKRQVGSTFKPILYYAALENGFTASSTFTSEATTFNMDNGKTYSPKNYGEKYGNRDITLATAIAYSDNIYAVKTHLFLGENVLVDTAKRMGIEKSLQANASLALGTEEISMLDFSNAYNTLANYGVKNDVYLINKVTDNDGNVLYEHKFEEESVLNKRDVFILNELLSNTYNYDFVDYSSPTMLTISNLLTKKYAVKSGSTNTDYWAVGYNSDMLVMVWNGYDDNRDTSSSQSKITKRIWARTIESLLEDKEASWYDIPTGITASLVNPISGQLTENGKKTLLFYIKGTEPNVNSNAFNDLFLN